MKGNANRDDGILALDASGKLLLLDFNYQVARLVVGGHVKGDGEVANGLRPLVGKSGLLSLFAGAGSGIFDGVGV